VNFKRKKFDLKLWLLYRLHTTEGEIGWTKDFALMYNLVKTVVIPARIVGSAKPLLDVAKQKCTVYSESVLC
jgi:hypothetical protein